METLEKLKTEQLNLLLDFFNDQRALVRQPFKQVEERLDKELKDFYTEFTENIVELRGMDLRNYAKSVYYALKGIDLHGYSTSISFTAGMEDLVKFRRLHPYNFMSSLRHPVPSFYDEGMDSTQKTSRLIHVAELMEHLRNKMKEAQNFVEATYLQAERFDRYQRGLTDSISEKLFRFREDLFLEAISVLRSREKWEGRPEYYNELLHFLYETSHFFRNEIRYNYFSLNHNITRPYLLEVQALVREIYKEFSELEESCESLLREIEYLLKKQKKKPFHQDLQDFLNGSDFERLLMHLHEKYIWRDKKEPFDYDVERVLSNITDLDMSEDVKSRMITMLKTPRTSWPEEYQETVKNLEAYYSRVKKLNFYEESIKVAYQYPGI